MKKLWHIIIDIYTPGNTHVYRTKEEAAKAIGVHRNTLSKKKYLKGRKLFYIPYRLE